MSVDPGKVRFYRNWGTISKFVQGKNISPRGGSRDFIRALADLLYNHRREHVIASLKRESAKFTLFVRKALAIRKREAIFRDITDTIRKAVIHLLNKVVR